jgi:hypothetical protein
LNHSASPGQDILKVGQAGCQWLVPIILATQEAEIRKIHWKRERPQYKKGLAELLKW